MQNKKNIYTTIIKRANSLLNLTLEQAINKYKNYPVCLIDYQEKGMDKKSLEIRFNEDVYTITCIFDPDDKWKSVFLFPDKNELIDDMIAHLNKRDVYDFKKGRWTVLQSFMEIHQLDEIGNDFCLAFYK